METLKDLITSIYEFNENRDLIDKFDYKTECKMLVEELIESSGLKDNKDLIMDFSLQLIDIYRRNKILDSELLDSYYDLIYVAIGSGLKLITQNKQSISKEEVIDLFIQGFLSVCEVNYRKTGYTDENGKFIKDSKLIPTSPIANNNIDKNQNIFNKIIESIDGTSLISDFCYSFNLDDHIESDNINYINDKEMVSMRPEEVNEGIIRTILNCIATLHLREKYTVPINIEQYKNYINKILDNLGDYL